MLYNTEKRICRAKIEILLQFLQYVTMKRTRTGAPNSQIQIWNYHAERKFGTTVDGFTYRPRVAFQVACMMDPGDGLERGEE